MKNFFVVSLVLLGCFLYVHDRWSEEKNLKPQSNNIFMAIESYNIPDIEEYAKDKKNFEIVQKYTGETPLIHAITYPFLSKTESFFIVKLLINAEIDINAQSSSGNTALLHAVALKEYEIASYLIKHGANPNIANINGDTLLTVFQNDDDACMIIKSLVEWGGSLNHKNNNGDNALSIAKKYNNPGLLKSIEALLTNRANAARQKGY